MTRPFAPLPSPRPSLRFAVRAFRPPPARAPRLTRRRARLPRRSAHLASGSAEPCLPRSRRSPRAPSPSPGRARSPRLSPPSAPPPRFARFATCRFRPPPRFVPHSAIRLPFRHVHITKKHRPRVTDGIKSDEEPDLAGIFEPTEPSAEVEETLHNIQDEQSTYADDEECRIFSGQGFDPKTLGRLSDLIARSLHQDIPDDDSEQLNQKQFIASGYRRWADRFPGVRNVVHQHVSV
ncbi:hypothetical protein ZWY2020_037549 [Hordeum vulgare]|nr:hypothetical protein ZWY2020_037549 [Hordeum vulgare]